MVDKSKISTEALTGDYDLVTKRVMISFKTFRIVVNNLSNNGVAEEIASVTDSLAVRLRNNAKEI